MFLNMWGLQRACEVQVSVDQTGKPVSPVSQSIGEQTEKLLQLQMASETGLQIAQLEFQAMQRLADKQDDSYRDL